MEGSLINEISLFQGEQSCLLCLKSCSVKEEIEKSFEKDWNLVGAGSNALLKKHLQQIFVLRRVLEMPVTWCERLVQKLGEEEMPAEEDGQEGEWFRVCQRCTEGVKECWRLYQEILRLQVEMEDIKGRVKSQLELEVKRKLRKEEDKRKIGWIEKEIYGVLFPLEFNGEEVHVPEELEKHPLEDSDQDPANMEVSSNYSFEWDQAILRENDDTKSDSDSSYCPDNEPERRGPGRPPAKKRGPGRPPTKPKPLLKRRPGRPPRKLASPSTAEGSIQDPLPPQEKRPRGRPRLAKNYLPKLKRAKMKSFRPDPWYRCTLCPSKFLISELLTSHLEAHKICNEFLCSECSFPALTSEELDHHKRIRHTPNGFHRQCPECSFVGSVRHLKTHILENHPDSTNSKRSSQILCSICSKICSTNQALSNHQRKMHPEQYGDTEKNVQCSQCGLLFPSRIRLQHHMRNTHLKVTKLVCDICGKGFSFRAELKRHSAKHKEDPKGDFICAVCGLDFQYAVTLARHTRKLHSSDGGNLSKLEGPQQSGEEFQCKYCDVKSPFKVVIQRHMRTHITGMGHKCDLCDRSYTSEQGLKRHLKINHAEGDSEKVNCSYCLKQFLHVEYLKGHQKYFCPILKQKKGDSSLPDDEDESDDKFDNVSNS